MDIRDAVESELIFDPLVDETDIKVKNMNGEVALNGTVPSYPQYLEAAAAAQRVAGVKNVHNHLEVVLPPGDYRDNAALTTMANNALALNITVPDGVEATARNGNLTLTGTGASEMTAGWSCCACTTTSCASRSAPTEDSMLRSRGTASWSPSQAPGERSSARRRFSAVHRRTRRQIPTAVPLADPPTHRRTPPTGR